MAIYLSLGSNQGERRENLRRALEALVRDGVAIRRVSPVVESPALLPPAAPPEWNSPYLNLVAECRSDRDPASVLDCIKSVEIELGRSDSRRWAPRPMDIDILLFDDAVIASNDLTIPHGALSERSFVLTPLLALAPSLVVPDGNLTVFELDRLRARRIPLWMGILNLTPDSFSDGGEHETWESVDASIDRMVDAGAHILDFGAESTRPGADAVSEQIEWERLEPILAYTIDRFRGDWLRPLVSVDTYHAGVAARALELGADLINDVGGLTDPRMIELAAATEAQFVAMHNLGLPADPGKTLDSSVSAADQVERWLDGQLESWTRQNVDPARIVFDPGIGFGKTPLQSLELLREIERFTGKGLRVLVGHSRKSFMKSFAGSSVNDRDLTTIGTSMALCERGVDMLRVHNVSAHTIAYRGWAHLQTP